MTCAEPATPVMRLMSYAAASPTGGQTGRSVVSRPTTIFDVLAECRSLGVPGLPRRRLRVSDTSARAMYAALSKFLIGWRVGRGASTETRSRVWSGRAPRRHATACWMTARSGGSGARAMNSVSRLARF
jgi:hypothetical protein